MVKGNPNKSRVEKQPCTGKSKGGLKVCTKTDIIACRTPKTHHAVWVANPVGCASTRAASSASRQRTRAASAAKKLTDSFRKPKVTVSEEFCPNVLAGEEEAWVEVENRKMTAAEKSVDEAQTEDDSTDNNNIDDEDEGKKQEEVDIDNADEGKK